MHYCAKELCVRSAVVQRREGILPQIELGLTVPGGRQVPLPLNYAIYKFIISPLSIRNESSNLCTYIHCILFMALSWDCWVATSVHIYSVDNSSCFRYDFLIVTEGKSFNFFYQHLQIIWHNLTYLNGWNTVDMYDTEGLICVRLVLICFMCW